MNVQSPVVKRSAREGDNKSTKSPEEKVQKSPVNHIDEKKCSGPSPRERKFADDEAEYLAMLYYVYHDKYVVHGGKKKLLSTFAKRFSDKGYSRSEDKLGEKISNLKRDLRYIVKVKDIPKHLLPILAAEIEELMEGNRAIEEEQLRRKNEEEEEKVSELTAGVQGMDIKKENSENSTPK